MSTLIRVNGFPRAVSYRSGTPKSSPAILPVERSIAKGARGAIDSRSHEFHASINNGSTFFTLMAPKPLN
ncbi:MAG: hypothetical protein JW891_18150 [Candidatus Lokiarchaeota archaeon]|nr:hypothetical protein [Candidatus Lokiarchaeota archaeon]